MRIWTARALAAALLLSGCMGAKIKRLSEAERGHYYALQVYMSEDQQKAFLKLKTEDERNQYLKDQGLYERFYKYEPHIRDAIIAGEVREGWTEDQVFMAWGKPYDRRRLTGRPASRSELFVYRFEVDPEGIIRVWTPDSKTAYKAVDTYQLDVYVDDSTVTEIDRKDRWE